MTSTELCHAPAGETVPEKVKAWERKLLDLSLRNALLNLRPGRNCLPVAMDGGKALEALLREGRELPLYPWMPEAESGEEAPDTDEEAPDAFDQLEALEGASLPQTDGLPLFSEEGAMRSAAKRMYRSARTAMDESGTGTLFMGIGMLRWTDGKGNGRVAPLVLIPVALNYRKLRWSLSPREGDSTVNITLLEKLRQEWDIAVPGVDPLPRDKEGGIDLDAVYAAFREAISPREDWAVLDQSALANFSYGAFVMWNDLKRRERLLMDNAITRSLITGISMPRPEPLKAEGAPLLPLDTDETQLEAVRAARRGESFVLHGPPGTGKSQTITTLIANLMADGRRVLFVAEKQAALDVVKRRLEAIGLDAYCVALYSSGASTRSALNQLQRLIDLQPPEARPDSGECPDHANRCAAEIDGMYRLMHEAMPCGFDLYTALQRHEALRGCPDMDPPEAAWLDALSPAALDEARRMLSRLVAAGRAVGHPARFPLRKLSPEALEPARREALASSLRDCRDALVRLDDAASALARRMGQPAPVTQQDHARLAVVASDAAFWASEARRGLRQLPSAEWLRLMDGVNHCVAAQQLRAQLEKGCKPEFFRQDGAALYAEWKALSENQLLKRLRGPGLLKRVNGWALKPVAAEMLWVPLRALANLQAEEAAAKDALTVIAPLLGDQWRGEATDWIAVQKRLSEAQAHADRFGAYGWLTPLRERLLADPGAMSLAGQVIACRAAISAAEAALGKSDGEAPDGAWIAAQIRRCDAALEALGKAGDWLAWLRCADEARAMGLGNAVRAYEGGMAPEDLPPSWEKALCGALIDQKCGGSEALKRFTGPMADALSEEYRALDAQAKRHARQALCQRLYERRTAILEAASATPDLSRLRRACASKRAGLSLRQLFELMPGLMGEVCGCMIMNPVSVAQFLPDSLPDFDVVIFDEASQLLTSRAVGALSRARAAIIVGDPNQMPPTSFFAAAATEFDDIDLEDLESVLDDCLAVGVDSRSLLWHYRSRHESLIAFSNRAFYEGRLRTFPSADARTPHVRTVRVDGVFERGARRVNRPEAQAVVDEIIRRSKTPELADRSVGIITFNLAQQNLIEDMLTAEAAGDAALSAWMERPGEPLFIKNLENVQGDERDVIFLCVSYGPDPSGAIHMNFGPLNRDGGWRRLNVAVTRAREEMVLFTSMDAADIRLGPSPARGVAELKSFLAYASDAGATTGDDAAAAEDDGIAEALCASLARSGWQTRRGVGRSGFRVSVAVIDPDDPGRYRLGILLDDGRASASVRDREITCPALLTGLGWRLTRLYALDWRRNPEGELRRVLALLDAARGQELTARA